MATPFEEDTHVEPVREGEWAAELSDRWDISVPNGGYVLAVALAAVAAEVEQPHPLAVSAHYLSPCAHGDARVEVNVLKRGRTLSTAAATLRQGGRDRVAVLATYGDLRAWSGPTLVAVTPPELPPPDECGFVDDRPAGGLDTRPPIADRVDFRPSPASAVALAARGAPALLEGWVRLSDGDAIGPAHLPLLVDAAPPAVFAAFQTGWVPTIELTVHVRGVPTGGWLRARIDTRVLEEGTLDEDCMLWDAEGTVVAMSRQLARILPSAAG